ncbi:hypothetical protein ZWY2020_051068 [Hordeum vulgare]|nr:hypothetical protein ZWY2020_051068 [Hordeum vulgare]
MPRGAQVSTPFASGFLAFSERIWSAPSMQVPLSSLSVTSSRFWFSLLLSLSSPLSLRVFSLSGLIFGVYSVHCSSSGFTSDGVTRGHRCSSLVVTKYGYCLQTFEKSLQ